MDSYGVTWESTTSGKCVYVDKGRGTNIGGSSNYTIIGLEENRSYIITVTATNAAGSTVSVPVTALTGEAGEGLCGAIHPQKNMWKKRNSISSTTKNTIIINFCIYISFGGLSINIIF